jgi:3-methylfumaryl-CoA hydratase
MSDPSPITGRPGPSGPAQPVAVASRVGALLAEGNDTIRRESVVDAFRTAALTGLLGVDSQPLLDDNVVSPMWHLVHLLDTWPRREIGPDGHSIRGLQFPPEAGSRRMFAGGRTVHHQALEMGSTAVRTARVTNSVTETGRSGRLIVVKVRHDITQGGRERIVDEQGIVYKTEGSPTEDPGPLEPEGDITRPDDGVTSCGDRCADQRGQHHVPG